MFPNGRGLGVGHTVGMRSLGHARTRRTWPGIGFAVLVGTGKMHFVEVDIRWLSSVRGGIKYTRKSIDTLPICQPPS